MKQKKRGRGEEGERGGGGEGDSRFSGLPC